LYPAAFTFKQYPKGSLPPSDTALVAYRVADRCFEFGSETAWIFVGVYAKDAEALIAWVQKHSDNAHCLGGPGFFVFVTDLKAMTVAGRNAVSFDQDLGQCGEGVGAGLFRHTTVFFLGSSYVFVFEWQSVDVSYAPTMQAIAEMMLASTTS
jgi:hypothetical protein